MNRRINAFIAFRHAHNKKVGRKAIVLLENLQFVFPGLYADVATRPE